MTQNANAPAAGKLTGAMIASDFDASFNDYTSLFSVGEDYPIVGTPEDAAKYLNLRVASIRELCRTGRLRAIKVGNLWRIPRAYLQEFIEKGAH